MNPPSASRLRAVLAGVAMAVVFTFGPMGDAWAQADVEFHAAVLNAANNELMSSLYNVVATALHSFFLLSARASDDFKYSLPQHFGVYDAIRRRSAPQARLAMQRLVDDSRRHLKQRDGLGE